MLPKYVELTSGQYFVDPSGAKSGPCFDANAKHQMYYSRYNKSKDFCITCHDVSNPVLANVLIWPGLPERQAAGTYFHIERTASEFQSGAYGSGGAQVHVFCFSRNGRDRAHSGSFRQALSAEGKNLA